MPAFPASLGELLLDGFTESPDAGLLRTPMEDGLVKQANVRSKELVSYTVTYRFKTSDFQAWKLWRKTDIANGALFFDWVNMDGVVVQARIPGGKYNAVPYDNGNSEMDWDVSFILEVFR